MSVCSGGKRSSSAISSDEEPISEKSDNTLKGSDEEAANSFKIVKRKSRKVARRQRKNTECTRMHINYTRAQNTKQGIRISTGTVEDFRKLNKFLISSNIPFHTFALEEERKIKVVIKGIPLEFETADIKDDLINQGYPVLSVHRMHRRNGTPLGMVLVILERNDEAREIFKNLARVCGLSGVTPEEPYKRGMPSQCHRCQLYGHAAANCSAQPRCVKCLVPHWTKDCERNKESGGKPSCNCATVENGDPRRDLHFDIITPLTPTHYPNDVNRRPDILDIALLKGVALKFSCIETLQCLNSDHRPVLMRCPYQPHQDSGRWQLTDSSGELRSQGAAERCQRTDKGKNAPCAERANTPHVRIGPKRAPSNEGGGEVRRRVSLPPKDDLDPITQDEVSKHIKALKIRKAPGVDSISSKALKCFLHHSCSLGRNFNACIKIVIFPLKEAVVIGIPKPGKPRDRPLAIDLSVFEHTRKII
ncbi:Nucleic-acid-binding protein from transposon X-element [Eumeta japonica]|uniref:Nucleic-acid-binding protein from transposon X-element n=1 Tax=Eumeta variegata TaxID=151549 RepID=A0A4C1VG72_EUMVA|nr:Nucleic-acid-binding protein from transposon X-element [Eumeta japonica]